MCSERAGCDLQCGSPMLETPLNCTQAAALAPAVEDTLPAVAPGMGSSAFSPMASTASTALATSLCPRRPSSALHWLRVRLAGRASYACYQGGDSPFQAKPQSLGPQYRQRGRVWRAAAAVSCFFSMRIL